MFAEAIDAAFVTIHVRPDWSDSTDLFGHVDLNGNFIAGAIIDFVKRAETDINNPYVLCLDEMNLAPVEQYFAEYLSILETRKLIKNEADPGLVSRWASELERLTEPQAQ